MLKRILILSAACFALASPASAEVIQPVPYGPGAEEYLAAFPCPTTSCPTVIFVHGGWWGPWPSKLLGPVSDEKQMANLNAEGFTVLDLTYTIPHEHKFPGEDESIERAVRWAESNAGTYGGDPSNIMLFGSSAGAQLASMVGVRMGYPTIKAVVELSAPGLDFVTLVELMKKGEGPAAAGVLAVLECRKHDFSDCTLENEERWSPVFHIPAPAECPAWLVAYGVTKDLKGLPAQGIEFYEALTNAGCSAELVAAKSGHAIAYYGPIKGRVGSFLRAH